MSLLVFFFIYHDLSRCFKLEFKKRTLNDNLLCKRIVFYLLHHTFKLKKMLRNHTIAPWFQFTLSLSSFIM